jgi:hypothetical protein
MTYEIWRSMYRKKAFGIILVSILSNSVYAQEIPYQTLNTTGQSVSNGNLQLESSVGEIASVSLSSGHLLLTQGFLQPSAGTGTIPVGEDPVLGGPGITSAGTTFINGSTLLEFTVGEAFSTTFIKPAAVLTQGLLQPYADDAPMPVALIRFEAKRAEPHLVQLDWITGEEASNHGFDIERRKSHEHEFQKIGFVSTRAKGGQSQQQLSYAYTDPNPDTGYSYYRLKQKDLDGSFTYSTIKAVEGTIQESNVVLNVSPVPTDGPLRVAISGTSRDVLMMYQHDGKLIHQLDIEEKTPLQIHLFAPGIYILRLTGHPSVVRKVVVR